ncbi:MAG: phosphatase PAP2 family protein [Chitinophagales bacterium]
MSNLIKILLLLVCFHTSSFAQNNTPYELDFKREMLLLGIGGIGSLTAIHLHKTKIGPLTVEEINGLNANDVNAFDRSATENWSTHAAKQSDYFLYTSAALPFTTLAATKIRKDVFIIGTMFTETVFINLALTDYAKFIARRYRPLVYHPNVPLDTKQSTGAQLAFFSGHAAGSASLCFFTAKILNDYYPNSKLKPLIWGTAATIPAITSYLRYKAGKHFPTDVIAGYLVGASVGYLIPTLHKKKKDKTNKTTLQVSPSWKYSGVNVVMGF